MKWKHFFLHFVATSSHLDLGGDSQSFLSKTLKIFVTSGLNILRFLIPIVFFEADLGK
jgi:hypothetical protein